MIDPFPDDVDLAKHMRLNPTPAEQALWLHLKGARLGVNFRRQVRMGQYILDLYAPSIKLAIELDGAGHEWQAGYDSDRDDWLASRQVVVIRFRNDEVFDNLEGVLAEIRAAIESRPQYRY